MQFVRTARAAASPQRRPAIRSSLIHAVSAGCDPNTKRIATERDFFISGKCHIFVLANNIIIITTIFHK